MTDRAGDGGLGEQHRERGASLVEVLAALLILLLVMLGILPLYVMAMAVDRVAEAQTEMTAKARAVVEVVRLVNSTGNGGSSGILPLATGTRALPYSSSDTGFDFWGPAGIGVVEDSARYRLSYEIADGGTEWVVTVFALPNRTAGGARYVGPMERKGVRYAARIPR